jgi:hypothetical protein
MELYFFNKVKPENYRAFSDVALCSLRADRCFKGDFITLMTKAVCTSETVVYSETTWRYIPEGSNLPTGCSET